LFVFVLEKRKNYKINRHYFFVCPSKANTTKQGQTIMSSRFAEVRPGTLDQIESMVDAWGRGEPASSSSDSRNGNKPIQMFDMGKRAEARFDPDNDVHAFTDAARLAFGNEMSFYSTTAQRSQDQRPFIKITQKAPVMSCLKILSAKAQKVLEGDSALWNDEQKVAFRGDYPKKRPLQSMAEQLRSGFLHIEVNVADMLRAGFPHFAVTGYRFTHPHETRERLLGPEHSQYINALALVLHLNKYVDVYTTAEEVRAHFIYRSYLVTVGDVHSEFTSVATLPSDSNGSRSSFTLPRKSEVQCATHQTMGEVGSVNMWPGAAVGDLLMLCYVRVETDPATGRTYTWKLYSAHGVSVERIQKNILHRVEYDGLEFNTDPTQQFWITIGECVSVTDGIDVVNPFEYTALFLNPAVTHQKNSQDGIDVTGCVEGLYALGRMQLLIMNSHSNTDTYIGVEPKHKRVKRVIAPPGPGGMIPAAVVAAPAAAAAAAALAAAALAAGGTGVSPSPSSSSSSSPSSSSSSSSSPSSSSSSFPSSSSSPSAGVAMDEKDDDSLAGQPIGVSAKKAKRIENMRIVLATYDEVRDWSRCGRPIGEFNILVSREAIGSMLSYPNQSEIMDALPGAQKTTESDNLVRCYQDMSGTAIRYLTASDEETTDNLFDAWRIDLNMFYEAVSNCGFIPIVSN
jgi:hypothetical protein